MPNPRPNKIVSKRSAAAGKFVVARQAVSPKRTTLAKIRAAVSKVSAKRK